VYNNTPVFFLRDPSNFPLFIHTQKRNPQTNLKDATMFWDYLSTHQECIHQVMQLFSDRGTPYGYRHMNGYSGHTHKFIKPDGSFVYVQIHLKTDQGIKTFTNEEAGKMASENPDFATQDLFEAIQKGDYPSWTVYVQVLTPEQAEKFKWNIFDLTKVWPQGEVPLRRFGKLTLNKNVENYFAEIEQVAFAPSHLVPGVEPSADPVLQSRLFSYPDTHRHRLGVNYQQIPVNAPLKAFNPFQRDGAMAVNGNYGANPNYPSSYRSLTYKHVQPTNPHEKWAGAAVSDLFDEVKPQDYVSPRVLRHAFLERRVTNAYARQEQATGLWKVLGKQPGQQENFINNVAGHLAAANVETRNRTYEMFSRVDPQLGAAIKESTEKNAS
jgi:catalase